jgi:hypothetical protein
MKRLSFLIALSTTVVISLTYGQNFSDTQIPFAPTNLVEFKLNQPIVHLIVNNGQVHFLV